MPEYLAGSPEEIAARLRALQKRSGVSDFVIGRDTGLGLEWWERITLRKTRPPVQMAKMCDRILRISMALKCSPEEILGITPPASPEAAVPDPDSVGLGLGQ